MRASSTRSTLLTKFSVHYTVLLMISMMLDSRFLELIISCNQSFISIE